MFLTPTKRQLSTNKKIICVSDQSKTSTFRFPRHGVAKTDFNILRDKTLSFHLVLENSLRGGKGPPVGQAGLPRMDLLSKFIFTQGSHKYGQF